MIRFRFLFPVLLLLPASCGGEEEPQPQAGGPEAKEKIKYRIPGVYEPGKCTKCGSPAGNLHRCNRTQWCPSCLRDCASNHICGKTDYCAACQREIGKKNHLCGKTKICWSPQCTIGDILIEAGSNHVCGQTMFHKECGFEMYLGDGEHDCPETYACPRCEMEVTRHNHICTLSSYCKACSREASVPIPCKRHSAKALETCPDCRIPHRCGETRFCPRCRGEKPTTHRHGATETR